MMANNGENSKRIDEPTGTEFVGHEWDGIEELDTPMPRWWLWTLYLTIIWGVVYVILYPAWPMVNKATEGYLGWTSRGQLAETMEVAEAGRAEFRAQLDDISVEELVGRPDLLQQSLAGGAAAFKVNCVQCHGSGAAGFKGYPNLNDDDWLWGGDIAAIETTIEHGIRWDGSDQSRTSLMPGFDGIFDETQTEALVSHVLSLSGEGTSNATGAQIYADNCVTCHQTDGSGDRAQGAPALNDAISLYGTNAQEIRQQIANPRHGVMPGWKDRLDPATIKMLAAYVHSLGGGEALAVVDAEPVAGGDE